MDLAWLKFAVGALKIHWLLDFEAVTKVSKGMKKMSYFDSGKSLIRMTHMGQTYFIVSFGEHHTYNLSYGPCSVNNET